MSISFQVSPVKCPYCGAGQDHVLVPDQPQSARLPKVGDVSICAECVFISRYDEDMQLTKLPQVFVQVMQYGLLPHIDRAQLAVLRANQVKASPP
jgi:hypothetical protein